MDRIKRLSYEILDRHKSKFGENFADNKKILDQISIIRSKGLKNEIAGYITKFIKKEIQLALAKKEEEANYRQQEEEILDPDVEKTETITDDQSIEIIESEPDSDESE